MFRTLGGGMLVVLALAVLQAQTPQAQEPAASTATRAHDVSTAKGYGTHFEISERCVACHNGMTTPSGEDISFGTAWKTSMMGNAGRDPYWMAGVRREMTDHPSVAAAIQDECSICHMPMMRYEAKLAGGDGDPFNHIPPDLDKLADRLSDDGVSCTVCHQITSDNFGTRESFVGGFKIDEKAPAGERPVYGPFEISKGHTTVMHSSSAFRPTEGKHLRASELCATCHTLITQAFDKQGKVVGELPEQVPYQEWLHSAYKDSQSCQSCHMPKVREAVPITSSFGEPREDVARHTFVGGNFFMQRLLGKFRGELAVPAQAYEMDAAAARTIAHLQSEVAKVSVASIEMRGGRLEAVVSIDNLSGHKFPTAYPSRRAWLHVSVKDRSGKVVFESGAPKPDGSIQGNDNDEDAGRFEPHHVEVTSVDQVQIYESVLQGPDGRVTTGLLTATNFAKDNRLLPRGFDKQSADALIAVHGDAERDADFVGGSDRIRYSVATGDAQGPFLVEAELWFQPIAYRWAMNLKDYKNPESERFVGYYQQAAPNSGVRVAQASAVR